MSQPTSHPRYLSHNNFGNNTIINQGDNYYSLTRDPLSHGVDRPTHVIPYPRNEDVICRQDLVKRLDQLLPQGSKFHSAALWGLGGSGKTQIALDYAYRRSEDNKSSVFWVHADSKATFIHDYKTIANKIGIDQAAAADENDLLRSVRKGIEARPSWVLILDNADNLELFGVGLSTDETANSIYNSIPNGPTGTVLWTSRDAHIAGTLVGAQRGAEVTSMEKSEAIELLEVMRSKKADFEELDDVETLLGELEWFPLAISQAGAYMRRMQTTASGYLSLLRESKCRWDTLKTTEFDRHRRPEMPNSVLDTWTVSMERIQSENRTAYQVLHIMAYLDNQNLPHELIVKISECSNKDTARQPEELKVTFAIMRLQEFSFLKTRHIEDGGPSYEMHKLVQEAARYMLTMRGLLGAPAQGALIQIEASDEVYYIGIALQALSELFPTSTPESWGCCERYLAHAIGMGNWAEMSKREADTSELLSKASGYLYDRGRWREKELVDQRALELRRRVLGERHPHTLESIASLAAAYHYQGKHEKAKACYKETVKLRRQTLGEKHPDTLRAMTLLGQVYQSHGQYKEAEALYKKALEFQREILGEKHLHTLQSLASISVVYHYQGYYAKAKPIKIKTLILQREVLGEKHPLTIWNIGSLAATCQGLGQFEEARALYQETLDLRRETLGDNHPDTLRSITQLGAIYHDLHKYKLAEALAKEALELEQKMLGEEHPYTLQSKHNLAVAWRSRGRRDEAPTLMQQCVQGRCAVLGPDHPFTQDSRKVLEKWESSSGGLKGIRKFLRIRKKKLGGNN
ncbi:P-loop containing nucleoside triphosphate hydrolase protein [Trichoderma evansii]